MVWNYLFASEGGNSFDPQLLEYIKEKNNEQVKAALQDVKNQCIAVDFAGASLLHYAAEYGNEAITQLLLESGAKVNLQNAKGQTPLILATKGEHEDTIRVLLDHGADIYLNDNNGISALQLAVHETLILPIITEMFLARIKTDCSSSEDIARKLLIVNCPLYIAVLLWNIDVVWRMLSEGSLIDASDPKSNRTALHVAVKNQDAKMVELLVDRGANVNVLDVKNQTPLALIRAFDDLEILRILVNDKTELTWCTEDGFMQVHWLLTKGTCEAVKIVLKSGLDLRATDSHDRSAIHYLASNANEGIVDALEDWINDGSSKSIFPFILYFVLGISMIRIAKKSVDWNVRDRGGRTILHDAMAVGNANFVKYLMDRGADANVKTIDGVTPFFEALESESSLEQRIECVKLIMEGGAYPDIDVKSYLKIHNTKSSINRDFPLLEPVLAHLVLRQTKRERVSEKIFESIDCHPKLKNYIASCREELHEMKRWQVWPFRMFSEPVTLFDFLADADYKIVFYADRRVRMKKLVDEYKFDSYYSRILRQRLSDITENVPFMQTSLGQIILIAMFVILMFSCALIYAPGLCRIREFFSTNKYGRTAVLIGLVFYIFYTWFLLREMYYYLRWTWEAYTKNLLAR